MKTKILIGLLLIGIVLISGCAEQAPPTEGGAPPAGGESGIAGGTKEIEGKEPTYPDDYVLKIDEIPEGFQLKLVSEEEANTLGVHSSPGYISKASYSAISVSAVACAGPDLSRIEKVYMSSYTKPGEPYTTIAIFAIKHTSEENLDKEVSKVIEKVYACPSYYHISFFLRDKDVLVMIISPASKPQVVSAAKSVAHALETRLNLLVIQ